jgi:TolB-like protein/Tfp pilus assembly protein PilF
MNLPSNITQQDITDQLHRILSSPPFINSNLLTSFLSFIVTESLEGRSKFLKEYTIGKQVLAKSASFDPREDASVRIHAGRLRKALSTYYENSGSGDQILISIPKGTYVPIFEVNRPRGPLADTDIFYVKPTLVIFPFNYYDKERDMTLADGICDQLCTEFTNFSELSVVSYYSSRQIAATTPDLRKAALQLDAKYILTGNIHSIANAVRISVQLILSDTLQQIWACTYDRERTELDAFAIQDDIIRHVVNQIAGSHGIIIREYANRAPSDKILDLKVFDSVFWFYFLVSELNEELFRKAFTSMKEAVAIDPKYAQGWAILGESYVAANFYQFDTGVKEPLLEAVRCGKKAIEIDPRCQHSYMTLGLAYLFLHDKKSCLQNIDAWRRLKPNNAVVSGGIGFSLICCGEYDQGYRLLNDSIQLNPFYPWWFNAALSIYHFHKNEFDDAIYWADKLHNHTETWELILKTAAYTNMGETEQSEISRQKLFAQLPGNVAIKDIVGSFLQPDDLIERLLIAVQQEIKTAP